MPNVATRRIQYFSESLQISQPVSFKIKAEYADVLEQIGITVLDDVDDPCPISQNLKMRKLQVFLDNKETIEIPVPQPSEVNQIAKNLKNNGLGERSVFCINLIGERYTRIPGFGNPQLAAVTIPAGFSNKISGTIIYESDSFGTRITARVAIEENPVELSTIAVSCASTLGEIQENGICTNVPERFQTRRVILVRQNATTQGRVSRAAPIAARGSIASCLNDAGANSLCIDYKGESAKNLHLFV